MEVASSSSSSTSATAAPPGPAPSSSQPLASSSSSSSSSLASSSSSNNAATYRSACKHLRNLPPTDLKTMLKRYALGVRWGKKIRQGLVQSLEPDEEEEEPQAVAGADDSFSSSGKRGRKRLLPHPLCSACYATLHKPYLCLSCGYAGCFYTSSPSSPAAISQGCLDRHLASNSSEGHNFAIEIHSGLLYCHGCHGAVKDVRFDAIYHRERARVAGAGGTGARPLLVDPADEEKEGDDSLACTRMPQHPTSSRVPRGIHNLGATCFLSVILQSFVHNPVLRNYFLSDRHNAELCGHAAGGQSCVACEMDRLFRDFFSHDALSRTPTQAPSPWTPNSFLYTVWRAQANEGSAELSQAGQQDSHELFISVLNAMHTALTAPGSDPASRKGKVPRWVNENDRVVKQQQRDGDHHHHHHHGHEASSEEGFASRLCDCIMHRTFSGILQSDVRCLVCGYRSSTHDPVLDLSVDLKAPAGGTAATSSATASSAGGGSALDDADPLDLLEGPASKKQKKGGAAGAAAGGVNGLKRDRDGSTPAGTTMKKTASKTGNLLPPTNASPSRKPSPSADDSSTTTSPLPPAQDLLDCLRRYCTSERLPPSSYSCPQCGPVEASKQLSLRRLPPVLCIQLKRFEHHLMGSGWSSKVEARVRFPVRLDVREFVTPSVLESGERRERGARKKKGRTGRAGSGSDEEGQNSEDDDDDQSDDEGNRSNDEDGVYDDDPLAIDDFLYTLFCVIVHEGTLNTGHYWCFAKWQDQWYRFNDAEAPRKCSVAEVVAQEKAVYQLVYVRRGLENVR